MMVFFQRAEEHHSLITKYWNMDVKLARRRRRRRMIELAMAALGSFKIIKHRSPLHLMDTRGYFQRNVRICMSTNPFFDIGTSNLKARGICKKQDYWELKMEQYLRVSEGKASPKRDFRALLRGRNHRSLKSNLTESIGQVNGGCVVSHTNENGFVRMKLVVRKQDLKQMLEVMRGDKSNANQASSSLSLEQRLNLLRRKHLSRSNSAKGSCQRSWTPALQSIPE